MTELVFILDRSGSMAGLVDDTIGGFNSLIEKQRHESGEALVSTLLFDTEQTLLHDRCPISRVAPMSRSDYYPRGCTALLDAIGDAIRHISHVHKYARPEDRPEKTLFVITTDGMENASRRYSAEKVKQMISHEQDKYGWEFLFLGANIDAAGEAARFGIAPERAVNYCCDSHGTALNYQALGKTISTLRSQGVIDPSWKKDIEADHKKRGKSSSANKKRKRDHVPCSEQ